MVPYAGPHLGWEALLVKYVFGAGVAMVLGLLQSQRESCLTSGSRLCMRPCRPAVV